MKSLNAGILLAILGAVGIILGPRLGFSELMSPWSFVLGFIFGAMGGIGVALTLFGLNETRKLRR
ncbi:MAG: hypothetical protein PVH84_14520 [Candidatus Aminicenantes bacterium]